MPKIPGLYGVRTGRGTWERAFDSKAQQVQERRCKRVDEKDIKEADVYRRLRSARWAFKRDEASESTREIKEARVYRPLRAR